MRIPGYGAAALVKTFLCLRFISLAGLVSNLIITASFIATMSKNNIYPPSEISGTLAISCMATFYWFLSLSFLHAGATIGLLVMTLFDILCLLSFAIVSIVIGQSVAIFDCMTIMTLDSATNTSSAVQFAQPLTSEHNIAISLPRLLSWASSTGMNCYWTKMLWAAVMLLAICFAGTSVILPALWFKSRRLCDVEPEVIHADDKHADAHAH